MIEKIQAELEAITFLAKTLSAQLNDLNMTEPPDVSVLHHERAELLAGRGPAKLTSSQRRARLATIAKDPDFERATLHAVNSNRLRFILENLESYRHGLEDCLTKVGGTP